MENKILTFIQTVRLDKWLESLYQAASYKKKFCIKVSALKKYLSTFII